MQTSTNKSQVLTLNGGQDEKNDVFRISDDDILNAQVVKDLGIVTDNKFLLD